MQLLALAGQIPSLAAQMSQGIIYLVSSAWIQQDSPHSSSCSASWFSYDKFVHAMNRKTLLKPPYRSVFSESEPHRSHTDQSQVGIPHPTPPFHLSLLLSQSAAQHSLLLSSFPELLPTALAPLWSCGNEEQPFISITEMKWLIITYDSFQVLTWAVKLEALRHFALYGIWFLSSFFSII